MANRTSQTIKSTNPFSSEDEMSDDDDAHYEQISTIKPYEEHFERFCKQFNEFINRTKQTEQAYSIPFGEAPFDILHLNLIVNSLLILTQKIDGFHRNEINPIPPLHSLTFTLHIPQQTVQRQGLFDINHTENKLYDKIACAFTYLDIEITKITEVVINLIRIIHRQIQQQILSSIILLYYLPQFELEGQKLPRLIVPSLLTCCFTFIKFENKILNVLSMYGERAIDEFYDEEEYPLMDGQAEHEVSKLFPVFKQALDLIKKIMGILYNIINQLNVIYYKKNDLHKNVFKSIELQSVMQTIGKGLSVVYVLDCTIQQNKKIRDHWNYYKRMIKIVQTDPVKFGSDAKSIKRFEKNIGRLDKTVLSGFCTLAVLGQNYDANKSLTSDQMKQQNACLLSKNKDLIELFETYFKNQIQFLSEIIDAPNEVQERKEFLYLINTYAFFRKVFPEEEDKKIYKSIWTLQRKAPVLEGHTHTFCYVHRFLTDVCPLSKKTTLDPKNPEEFIQQYVSDLDAQIPRKMNSFYQEFCYWISRMESIITSNTSLAVGEKFKREKAIAVVEEYQSFRVRLQMRALSLASSIRNLITSNLMLHINESIGFSPDLIKHLSKGIVILKSIESVYTSKAEAFQPNFITRALSKQLLQTLGGHLDRLTKSDAKQKKPVYAEFRAALQNIMKNLRGPLTSLKISNIEFSLNFAYSAIVIEKKECIELKYLFWKLKVSSQFTLHLQKATNCSFLFWCKDILPLAMRTFFENPGSAQRMIYLSSALSDTQPIVKAALHLPNPDYLFETFKAEILTIFKEEYLTPLVRLIDDFLRIQIHAMLIDKVVGKNPVRAEMSNIKKLLDLERIQFFDVIVDVRKEIQSCLNEKFYNINVLNMHDMETYEEMRSLARVHFDLNLMHVFIPSQTIEQGQLDILTILRDIPIFVDTHTYNLHNQTFTQITNDSKVVLTISIQQISDSIRTHGLGILSTAVNSIFKYITIKIQNLSNLLFDELILQTLLREEKWFNENRDEINGYYPFERAQKMVQNFKKLGISEDQRTYLDNFRGLIVQIGNSLGFVRLLRSASLNYCSKSIEFLPSQMDSDELFVNIAREAQSGQATVNSANELDQILNQLKKSFSSSTDYLKIIVSALKQFAMSEAQKHFTNFHILVPALTLNYVQHVLMSKDRVPQRNSKDAFLSNDGFVIGISYLLKLFNLEERFHLIHWQEEVRKKYKQELKEVQELSSQANDKSTSQRKLEEIGMQRDLSIRKLEGNLYEYNLFFNTFQACKILFREDPV